MEEDIDNHHHTPRLTRATNIGSADDLNTGQSPVLSNGAQSHSVDSLDDQPKNKLLGKWHRQG